VVGIPPVLDEELLNTSYRALQASSDGDASEYDGGLDGQVPDVGWLCPSGGDAIAAVHAHPVVAGRQPRINDLQTRASSKFKIMN
jgi:hypothetical protein